MFKNIFKSMLFVALTICCFSSRYANGDVENSKTDQVAIQNFSAENIYYKENPWDFVENYLMMEPGRMQGGVVLADAAIPLIFCVAAILVDLGINVAFEAISGIKIEEKPFFGISLGIAAASGLTAGIFAAIAFHKYMTSPVMRYENLISILKNYDPDLNNSNPKNTKLYIPKELYSVFDALWNVYKQHGEDVLKAEWRKIAYLIRNKIFYDLKSAKYVKPETNTYVTVIR